ncbi:MAG: hypothetical protein WBA99_18685 [Nodosilinea sp.]
MNPSYNRSFMTDLACAVSLGLLITATSLGLSAALQSYADTSLCATIGAEDDRGSGRLSRVPVVSTWLSLRGSGRIDPQSPSHSLERRGPLAYRGSGRLTEPGAAEFA